MNYQDGVTIIEFPLEMNADLSNHSCRLYHKINVRDDRQQKIVLCELHPYVKINVLCTVSICIYVLVC